MKNRTYVLTSVNTALALLRPRANYVMKNTDFISWNDPRPIPSWDEINNVLKKLKEFEDSIESIEL